MAKEVIQAKKARIKCLTSGQAGTGTQRRRAVQSPIDMVNGPLLRNILRFAPPLMLANLMQRFFNAADTLIVGRYCGEAALAAVGAASPIVVFFVWSLNGLSIGADVLISGMYGRRDDRGIAASLHTAYGLSVIIGVLYTLAGILFASRILDWMAVPREIRGQAALYMRIYCSGLIFTSVYDFCASILRSGGDTKRPMLYLSLSGLANVLMNLLFVLGLGWNVEGVAIATALSQLMAAGVITYHLLHEKGVNRLDLKHIRPDPNLAKQILAIGLPAGVQGMFYSVSNIIVQASVNLFGAAAIAANSAATTIEDFVYVTTAAYDQTCVTFTGQNAGAGNWKRIRSLLLVSLVLVSTCAFTIGFSSYHFGKTLLALFTDSPEVIRIGLIRLRLVGAFLFLNGLLDIFVASMRGMGYSTMPTLFMLTGICGTRIIYNLTCFAAEPSLERLYLCFPVSWVIALTLEFLLWLHTYRKHCGIYRE